MKVSGTGIAASIIIFIVIAAAIISILFYLDILAMIIAVVGLVCVIGLILGIIIIGIVSIIALGYFMAAKKPEVQETGSYTLDQTIDSKDYDKKD